MAVQSSGRARKFHLFNCDKTCNPSQVESLLRAVDDNVDFKIEMVIQQFCKHEMNTLVKRIPELKMDYGVLIIHANDSLLFEENSYGELCKSMTQNSRSGQKIIIVVCGDENYKDKDEETKAFSQWAWKKISIQCSQEYLKRSQVFLLSWKDKHRKIHEEELLHFLAPNKKGKVFEPQPKEQSEKLPVVKKNLQEISKKGQVLVPKPKEQPKKLPITPNVKEQTAAVGPGEEKTSDAKSPTVQSGEKQSDDIEGSKPNYKSGTVLLSTVMRYGVISYKSDDVKVRKNDKKWRVSSDEAQRLEKEWKSIHTARLTLVTDDNGVVIVTVKDETRWFEKCSIS